MARVTSAVGLDFGGTSIKAGHIRVDGTILATDSIPIELDAGCDDVLERAAELARSVGANARTPLGVGCAGLIDRDAGRLVESPNLEALSGCRLAAEIARRVGVAQNACRFENDANVAALGEQWLGAGRGVRDLMVITLGTGIGGGIVLAGELFVGTEGRAGEIGHVSIDPNGRPCGCGSRGCLEDAASATAARRRAVDAGLPPAAPGNLELLAESARAGNGPEERLMFEIGRDLGHGLAYPAVLFDITCFVFAGGFSAALDVMEAGMQAGLEQRLFGNRTIRLLAATLAGSAGWIGAARLVLSPDNSR